MDTSIHTMQALFSQLGLESGEEQINLKTAVEYIPANKNQHKLDKENCVM